MLRTRLVTRLKNWVAPALILGAGLATLGLAPSVYDTNVLDVEGMEDVVYVDTTYDDGRFVILKTVTCMAGLCQFDEDLPNDYSVRYKNDKTQALLFTWETGFGDAVDSASVDSMWTAWGYLDPQAYALGVPGEPSTPGSGDPYIYVDWSDYATDSALLADRCSDPTACTFRTTSWGGNNPHLGDWSTDDDSVKRVMLDPTVIPPTPGATKSLRYDWRYTYGVCEATPITQGGICSSLGFHLTNFYVDTSVAVPDPKNTTELWVEAWFRYGPNYSPCNVKDQPCAYKTVFLALPGSNGRSSWRLGGRGEGFLTAKAEGWKVGNAGAGAGISHGPVNGDSMIWPSGAASHIDAQWNGPDVDLHVRYRDTLTGVTDTMWHLVQLYHHQGSGMTPSTATLDGRIVLWLDSVLLYDSDYDIAAGLIDPWNNFNWSAAEPVLGFTGIDFGHNKDKGGADDTTSAGVWTVPRIETMYYGPVSIYREDPGWLTFPADTPVRQLVNIRNYDPPGYPGG